jgi:hypothetical protein
MWVARGLFLGIDIDLIVLQMQYDLAVCAAPASVWAIVDLIHYCHFEQSEKSISTYS